jgi:hypothetical protein
MQRRLLRLAAVLLALATAALLVQLGLQGTPRLTMVLLLARALTIGALFQLGLFWAADARGWQLLAALAAMLPSALIFIGLAGEALVRLTRGYAPNYLVAFTAVCGVLVYAIAFWWIVREQLIRPKGDAASEIQRA